MIRIKVGSHSILKIGAVQQAIDRLGLEAEIVGVRVESGVPNQPYGAEQTAEGAMNRARAVHEPGGGSYAIGIENGLVPSGSVTRDVAYVCVYAPSGRRIVRKSIGIPVPSDLVEASLASKQTLTAGRLEAQRNGSDPADAYPIWSKGQTTREEILTHVLYTALLVATINEEGEMP